MASSPVAAQEAKVQLALMRGGAPNHLVLQARNLKELLALAQMHNITIDGFSGEERPALSPPHAEMGSPEDPPLRSPTGGATPGDSPPYSYRVRGADVIFEGAGGDYQGERNEAGEDCSKPSTPARMADESALSV
jgi:hypothetical protein